MRKIIFISIIILNLTISIFAAPGFFESIFTSQPEKIELPKVAIQVNPVKYTDFLKILHKKYFKPVFKVIEERFEQIDKVAEQRKIIGRHVISAGYGSGFLRYNHIGNDLDFSTVIDLGTIKFENYGDGIEEFIYRLENYIFLTKQIFNTNNSPGLCKCNFYNSVNSLGKIPHRETIKMSLINGLKTCFAGKKIRRIVKSHYRGFVPMHLDTNELVFDGEIWMKYYSDKVKYSEEMLAGIREISVAYYFLCKFVEQKGNKKIVKDCIIYPTFIPFGKVFNCKEDIIRNVWVNEKEYEKYLTLYSPSKEQFREQLSHYGAQLITVARDEMTMNRKIKVMKRTHQAFDALEKYIDKDKRETIRKIIISWLDRPAATTVETIREQSKILTGISRKPELYKMFKSSGDIKKIIDYFVKVINEMPEQFQNEKFKILKKYILAIKDKDLDKLTFREYRNIYSSCLSYQQTIVPSDTEYFQVINQIQKVVVEKLNYLLVRLSGIAEQNFKVYVYDLKNEFADKKIDINYLKKRGFEAIAGVNYDIIIKKEMDSRLYSRTYWLNPEK